MCRSFQREEEDVWIKEGLGFSCVEGGGAWRMLRMGHGRSGHGEVVGPGQKDVEDVAFRGAEEEERGREEEE